MPVREATVEIAGGERGALMFRLLASQVDYPGMLQFANLALDPSTLPPLDSRANVVAYGAKIREALLGHAAVSSELTQIFGTTAPDRASLRFAIGASEGESLRWETLCVDPDKFVALNGLCSLRRIALAGATADPGLRIFANSLKMLAFLSPIGVKARDEFQAITGAVGQAIAAGFPVTAKIYLGEEELLEAATADIAAGKLPGIAVAPIPSNVIAFEQALKDDPAEILHFFCHGFLSDTGLQLLEFASINDHEIEAPRGSVPLSIERLSQILATAGTVWLTVLNSCSGALAVPRLHSMASALARNASPVAVGMAEPIMDNDATLFAGSFYPRAFELIADALHGLAPGAIATIDLGPAVGHAREVLHTTYDAGPADAFGRWCLPILYQRNGPLAVAHTIDPERKERIDTVTKVLRGMAADTPAELRDQILALLDKPPAVPPRLRPDRFGNLP